MLRPAALSLLAISLGLATALGAGPIGCGSGDEVGGPERVLALSLARFAASEPGAGGAPQPLPAAVEFLVPEGGTWRAALLEDPESNVFHKAMAYPGTDGRSQLLTAAGSAATLKLWQKESGWSSSAHNSSSGAHGIPQSLPGSKMSSHGSDWSTSARTQIAWGLDYIAGRYGNPSNAWAHSQSRGWY